MILNHGFMLNYRPSISWTRSNAKLVGNKLDWLCGKRENYEWGYTKYSEYTIF